MNFSLITELAAFIDEERGLYKKYKVTFKNGEILYACNVSKTKVLDAIEHLFDQPVASIEFVAFFKGEE